MDVKTLLVQGGLIKVEIKKKSVFIGTNGGFVYVGCRLLHLAQLKEQLVFCMGAIHSCAYLHQLGHSNLFFSINSAKFERLEAIPLVPFVQSPKRVFS